MPETIPKGRAIEAEIFSAGTWNGETFTSEDLEEIARNFELLREVLSPPLKFGHDAEQTLLGQADGDPALGWVEALRVEEGKLVATFAGVPDVVHEAIREGLYRHVSAELYFDVRHEGRALGKALKAVALLGADLPAVTNLEDLTAYLSAAQAPPGAEVRRFTLDVREGRIAPQGEDPAPQTAEERELAELRAFKAREERRRKDEAENARVAGFQAAREEARRFCERAAAEGRLPPYLGARLLHELDGQRGRFSGRAPLAVSLDWVRAFVAQAPRGLPEGELALAADPGAPPEEAEDPSRTLARLASAKMVELNLGYGKAADYVLNTNPGLARAYREYILKANLGG